ncbi:MAG: hypothetical protein ABJI33_01460 [Balneola sp.]
MKGTITEPINMEITDIKVMSSPGISTANTDMAVKGIVIPMVSKAEKKKIPIVAINTAHIVHIKNTGTRGTAIAATITEPTIMIMDTSKKIMNTQGISTVKTAMAMKVIVMENMITLSTKNMGIVTAVMTTEPINMEITGMEATITVRALCR